MEKAIQLGVDTVRDKGEIFGPVLEIQIVGVDYQKPSLVGGNPVLVLTVKAFKVLETHTLLVVAAPFLDLAYKMGHTGAKVNQKVGKLDHRHHHLEKEHIGVIVPLGQVPHFEIVAHENVHALEYGPVLNDDPFRAPDFEHILEAHRKEIGLQIVGPAGNVLVVVFKIRVVCHGLVLWSPAVMGGKEPCQGGLAAAYVACYSYVHNVSMV